MQPVMNRHVGFFSRIARLRSSVRLKPLATGLTMLPASLSAAQPEPYTVTNLGKPANAYSVIGVRMNNLGHVAGWSQYFNQGEPSLKGWVWTPENGFTILPPPIGTTSGRGRAMDISDTGIVGGDGGFDSGLASRYENNQYTMTGDVEGTISAYLGGINDHGDLVGTAKDAQFTTPDIPWLSINGGELIALGAIGGRATDINNTLQVSGYSQGPLTAFQAFRWDPVNGTVFLGSLGLTFSFATGINERGQVVGYALNSNGNRAVPWIYTDGVGMMQIPDVPTPEHSAATAVNLHGEVVGTTDVTGPDLAWFWSPAKGFSDLNDLYDAAAENAFAQAAHDINDSGQILAMVSDNNAGGFGMVILTPPEICIPDLNNDGLLDSGDISEFVSLFLAGDLAADLNSDGFLDSGDISAFVDAFLTGC